jgi:hypothetical protein
MMEKESGSGKRDKDELVDQHIVDWIRKEIGDPFRQHEMQDSA